MKTKRLTECVLAFCLLLPCLASMAEKPVDPAGYKEVELNAVRGAPEDFKNKLVCFQAKFSGLRSDFPRYLEGMGFKDDKYFLVTLSGFRGFSGGGLPVIAKKSDASKTALTSLPENSKVTVYGKIKRFQHGIVGRSTPDYYLDVDMVVELAQDDSKPEAKPGSRKLDNAVPRPPKDFGKP